MDWLTAFLRLLAYIINTAGVGKGPGWQRLSPLFAKPAEIAKNRAKSMQAIDYFPIWLMSVAYFGEMDKIKGNWASPTMSGALWFPQI
jgi:hypothetical protein